MKTSWTRCQTILFFLGLMTFARIQMRPNKTFKDIYTGNSSIMNFMEKLIFYSDKFVSLNCFSCHVILWFHKSKRWSFIYFVNCLLPFSYGLGYFARHTVFTRRTFLPSHFKIHPRKLELEPRQNLMDA